VRIRSRRFFDGREKRSLTRKKKERTSSAPREDQRIGSREKKFAGKKKEGGGGGSLWVYIMGRPPFVGKAGQTLVSLGEG